MLFVSKAVFQTVKLTRLHTRLSTSGLEPLIWNNTENTVRVDKLIIACLGTNSAGVMRFYSQDDTVSQSLFSLKEIQVAVNSSADNDTVATVIEEDVEIYVKPSSRIYVGFTSAGTVNVSTGQNVFDVSLQGFEIENR